MTAGYTLLRPIGSQVARKRVRVVAGAVEVDGVPNIKQWVDWTPVDWQALEACADGLRAHSNGSRILVPGALAPGLDPAGPHRRLKYPTAEYPATIVPVDQHWIAVDIDGLVVDEAAPEEMLAQAAAMLPPAFRGVSFVYQWTGSYLVKGPANELRARVFFRLSAPCPLADIAAWMSGPEVPEWVDRTIYSVQSIIYIAAPSFEGLPDPVPSRVGIVWGVVDEVGRTQIPPAPVVAPPHTAPTGDGTAWELAVAGRMAEAVAALEHAPRRHHAALAAYCDCRAYGAPPDVVAPLVEDLIRGAGREPQPAELANFERYFTDHAPAPWIAPVTILPDESTPVPEADESGTLSPMIWDPKVGPGVLAAQWRARAFPDVDGAPTLLRLEQTWWEYDAAEAQWVQQADTEWLPARIRADAPAALSARDVDNIADVLIQTQRRALGTEAGWIVGTGPATIIPLRNGLFDYRTRTLLPSTPRYFSPTRLPFGYDPAAVCPHWRQFLTSTFAGEPAVVVELQKWFGHLLEPTAARQRMAALIGATGTGKGVTADVMAALVGTDATRSPALPELANDFGKMSLVGCRLIIIDENTDGGGRAASVGGAVLDSVKKITGHGQQTVNRKYKDPIKNCVIEGKMVWVANTLPSFSDPSGAMLRRFVPFRYRHKVQARDDNLFSEKLRPEMPGILLWTLEGLAMLERDDFTATEGQRADVAALEAMTDPLHGYCLEIVTLRPGAVLPMSDLYLTYQRYAHVGGKGVASRARIVQMLVDRYPSLTVFRGDGETEPQLLGITLTPRGEELARSAGALRPMNGASL